MSQVLDLKGTSNPSLQIEKGGTKLKNNAQSLQVRNAADTADAELTSSKVNISGEDLVLNSDAAGTGNDWRMTIRRALTGMAAHLTWVFPASYGSAGQVLGTDGNGNITLVTIGGSADKVGVDTTTIAFNSTSPVTAFTLPANAVVSTVDVIIDTAFNGTPSLSVGITGTTSKYMGSNEVDLKDSAGSRWTSTPNNAPVGTTESIIITYAAGGATAGSARVLVSYFIPA